MIIIINGPNLNLLGRREPGIYGTTSFEEYLPGLRTMCRNLGPCDILYLQSNSEGEIIDAIQRYGFEQTTAGIIINPGAYAHYSIAIADAVSAVPAPVVEVHISNVFAREEFRHKSVVAPRCVGSLCGFGLEGYAMAARFLIERLKSNA
ncbi:MAG: type II 3-dehydroquinate dehydratase [Muribaculaceae bacterium]|nr:type II 3-dehydroquinate dehydratase [Muribaculaceae bacterium]